MDNEQRWQRALDLAEDIEFYSSGKHGCLSVHTKALAWQSGDGNKVRVYTGNGPREYVTIRRDGTAKAAFRANDTWLRILGEFNEALEVAA